MKEVLLCECPNSFIADNVIDILNANGIVLRQHDETMNPRIGAYGPNPGIAIYVFENDYEKARLLVDHVINCPTDSVKLFCPKCGSEDTVQIKKFKYVTLLSIISIFFIIAPCVYVFNPYKWGIKSVVLDYLSLAMAVAGIVIMIICKYKNVNYRCNSCGKKFNQMYMSTSKE